MIENPLHTGVDYDVSGKRKGLLAREECEHGPNDFMVQQLRQQITQQAICDAIWMDTAICSRRKIPRHTRRRLKREGRGLQAGRASAIRLRFVRGSPSCKLRPGMNKAEMNVAVCLHRRAI